MTRDAGPNVAMILASVACLWQLTFSSPPPADACSRIARPPAGALAADGSVVFTFQEPDDAHPGRLRLVHYSATGVPAGETRVDLGIVDASIDARGIDRAGNIWLAIRCFLHPESELCNRLALLTPNGEISQTLPIPDDVELRFDTVRERFINSQFDQRQLSITPFTASQEAPLLHLILPQDLELDRHSSRPDWAVGGGGEAALAIATGEEIRLLRYDSSGRLKASASFPAARSGDHFDDSETPRLGPIG